MLGLRYNADLRTLAFCAAYFALVAFQFKYDFESTAVRTFLFILTSFSTFQGAVSVHNAVHCPTFKNMTINRLFQVVLSLWFGHMAASYVPGHNLSHHRNLQTVRDVMRTTKMRYKWNFLNGLLFTPSTLVATNKNDAAYFKVQKKLNRPIYYQLQLEMACYVTSQVILGFLNPWKWLTVCWLPHLLGKYMIISLNMLQHDGCDENSKYNHSRNFVSWSINFFYFNNGYHTIHHIYPGKHWSILKKEHETRVAPHIHPSLDDPSIWAYLFRAYIFPGIRLTYDGKPYVPPPPADDEPWFYATTESYSDRLAPSYTACTNPQDVPVSSDGVANADAGGAVGSAWGRGIPLAADGTYSPSGNDKEETEEEDEAATSPAPVAAATPKTTALRKRRTPRAS